MRWARAGVLLLSLSGAGAASAQTILDQQHRLIDIHALLLDLPPVAAPAAYRAYQVGLGLEVISIPSIDGATGAKRQITASDRTPLFPRPRLAFGLPAPEGFRAFAGLAYIPPLSIEDVSTHYGAAEAGITYAPGPLAVGLRGHVVYAFSRSPVTEPQTRDSLETFAYGADLGAGYRFEAGWLSWTPYAGVGVTHLHGRFRVSSDGVVLTSDGTELALHAGVRLLVKDRWEAVGELDAYPGRLVHPNFRVAYVFDLK
jgi:Autotransporter beta-domain